MSKRQSIEELITENGQAVMEAPAPELQQLLSGRSALHQSESLPSVVTGELIAITDEGRTPLVLFAGQLGNAAVRARAVVDLHGAHIGHHVVLMFEGGDASRPIVMGVLRHSEAWPLAERPAQVEVDADGERMILSAREQLVMRCGRASITLTRAGKVLIQGSYVLSRSTGVNRVKGGAVQIN
nr:DUF6484 domain-containing protein [Variovorax paradoxus]